jgi:hypothetical protein
VPDGAKFVADRQPPNQPKKGLVCSDHRIAPFLPEDRVPAHLS